jgi:hypothetical protein
LALLDQLRLLDRALRDVRVREALRTGDRGGRRLARFAGSVAPADLAVLRAVDARRFEAVAQRQAEMIRDRWWSARFPGTLAGTALALAATTREVALGALAAPSFDRREGEDETGIALFGYVLGREDRTQDPEWLADLVSYEYLTAVGLPRRAGKKTLDQGLEARALPEGTRFLDTLPKKPSKEDLALARRVVVLPVEYPVSEIRDALKAGQEVPELDATPGVIVFLVDEEGATEIHVPALGHDLLDVLGQGPVPPATILDAFDPEDKRAAHGALSVLVEAGVVVGPLPPQPPEPEPVRKGKKSKKAQASASTAAVEARADGAATADSKKPAGKKKAQAKPEAKEKTSPAAPAKKPNTKPTATAPTKPAAKKAAAKKAAKPAKKPGRRH